MDRKLVFHLAVVSLFAHVAEVQSKEVKPVRPRVGIEQCWGVAVAGQNQCGNIAGTHTCAGEAKVDHDPGEWAFVVKGTCKSMGGLTHKQATKLHEAKSKAKPKSKDKAKSDSNDPKPPVKPVQAKAQK
jgi:uncharacterized membrane protein